MVSNKIHSKRGVSLPIAMAITAVLVILSASLIAIALSSITNTSSSVNSRQAYLNARSAIEYAAVYYMDDKSGVTITEVKDEYMVMDDKEGGTTDQGAHFVADEEAASEFATYVVANYVKGSSSRDPGVLKIKAFASSSDAFGGRKHSVKLSAAYSMKKLSSKNRITITDVDMSTDVTNMDVIRDCIQLHCKQYPGQNWTPFYYVWTYKDTARMYELTKNCYGLESSYKDIEKNPDHYYYVRKNQNDPDSEIVRASMKVPAAFNTNQKSSNALKPSGVWNAISNVQDDPRNGPVSYFAPGKNGWFDATYYIDPDQVNYFNLIITGKGKTLNGPNGEFRAENTQTNEMFHLWFLNNNDRNIYFEFLKPGMYYRSGSDWNGREALDDRMLVYVKNKKTTVHFKVKGIGDGDEGLVAPTKAPVIGDVSIKGTSIYDAGGSFASLQDASLNNFYGAENLENKSANELTHGIKGRTDGTEYFYGAATVASGTMIYEGQGWWVGNILTGKDFDLTVSYYDKTGTHYTDVVKVHPSDNDDAYIVVDLGRGTIQSYKTESRACDSIGLDPKSYTTVRVKSSEIGKAVAPYIDYFSQKVSTTGRRQLSEKIAQITAKYMPEDYEDSYYQVLQTALSDATDLVNDDDFVKNNSADVTEKAYTDMMTRLDQAIAQLRTKYVDSKVYSEYTKLVQDCQSMVDAQAKEVIYDSTVFAAFTAAGNAAEGTEPGEFTKAKNLINSGELLENASYTTTTVINLIQDLQDAKSVVESAALDKEALKDLIDECGPYREDTRYKSEYREHLKTAYLEAKNVYQHGPNQEAINGQVTLLQAAYDTVLSNPDVQIDTTELTALIRTAKSLVNKKENCTADTLKVLNNEIKAANKIYKNVSATQEMVDEEVVKLEAAIEQFTIYKPNENVTIDSKTADKLLSEGKMRVWVKGLNNGTEINEYVDDNGNVQHFDNPRVVSMFILSVYSGGEESRYSSRNFTFMDDLGMGYIDIPANNFTSVTLNLTCEYSILSEEINPSTGKYDVLDTRIDPYPYEDGEFLQVGNVVDGNLVVMFDKLHLKKIAKDNASTYNNENGEAFAHSLTLTKGKITELFVDAPSTVKAEITNPDGSTETTYSRSEDKYQVVRFVFRTTDTASQSVVLRYTDANKAETISSKPFASQIGQYVVKFDEATKEADSYYQVRYPLNSANILKAQVKTAWIAVNENNAGRPKKTIILEDNGSEYTAFVPFTGTDTVTFYRNYYEYKIVDGEYVLDETTLKTVKSNTVNVNSAGSLVAAYEAGSDTNCTYSYDPNGLPSLFYKEDTKQIAVKTIYPLYVAGSGSGSRSTGSSAYSLDGIVSSAFAADLITAPAITAATTKASAYFDYFGQAGEKSYPTKNLGSTVIWIDCSGDTLKQALKGNKNPHVYVFGSKVNGKEREFNGSWPGREAFRVEDSDIYYVVVSSDARGVIITDKDGKKIGGNPYDKNNIYLDLADSWLGKSITQDYKGANRSGFFSNTPGKCSIGVGSQGHCCLYTIIDDEVVNGVVHGQSKFIGRANEKKDYYIKRYNNSYVTEAPGFKWESNGHISDKSSAYYESNGDVGDYNLYFKYRAKRSDSPQPYTYTQNDIDSSQMTATNKRMAFVGGSKIRIQNMSYFESYGTYYYTGTQSVKSDFYSDNTQITYDNYYGGHGGNQSSDGRIGDAFMTLMYDWFEYKIPVDQSDTYTFQLHGVRYTPSVVGEKKWYDADYETDRMYTQQVHDVYGNVWLQMTDITPTNGIFEHMVLFTSDPEDSQVEDDQPIYFNTASGVASVEVKASGVGGSANYTMESYSGNLLKTVIPSKTPFLTFTVTFNDGSVKVFRSSIQGGDLTLFDPSFNLGKGGWDNYVPDSVRVERALYGAQGVYYGSVLVRQYNEKGQAKDLGQNGGKGSYKYASGLWNNVLNGKFDGEGRINSAGYSMSYSYVNNWVNAYKELYATMSNARAYLSGRNYPEYIHSGKPNIYDTKSIEELRQKYDQAENVYETAQNVNDIIKMEDNLRSAIANIQISTSDSIPIIFYDSQKISRRGAAFTLYYKEREGGVQESVKLEYFNTEGSPIVFVRPSSGVTSLYDLQFKITFADGTESSCLVKDEIPLADGAWVYVYQPAILPERPTDTSYWVQNTAADYRQVNNTSFTQLDSNNCSYDMVARKESISSEIPKAYSESEVQSMLYRPLTLYFKYDCEINCTNPADSYTIRAGAYTFEESCIVGHEYAENDAGPLTIERADDGTYVPRIDLYSSLARNYFTQPVSYGELATTGVVDASTLTNWVTPGTDGSSNITTGYHQSAKPVNMTVNSGSFAGKETSYRLSNDFYFRWTGNQNLKVYSDVVVKANSFTFATSGIVDSTENYNKHFYIGTLDDKDEMEVNFITDVRVQYLDKYGDSHDFTIREGSYKISRPKGRTDYIADLFDEDYWESMLYVTVNARYEAEGGAYGIGGGEGSKWGDPVFTND